jgi:4-diphosphocytidyl-2-C-methyl-D-erythritol kinase
MKANAGAKVNLFLHVTGKRADGYHLLESMVAFASDAYDIIEVHANDDISLQITGPFADSLDDYQDNIITKAARRLMHFLPEPRGCMIKLGKYLPIASGVGGGSVDAASAIKMLIKLWDLQLSNGQIQEICLKLGADVPVCYVNVPAYFSGIGENIEIIRDFPTLYAVLINDLQPVNTQNIFKSLTAENFSKQASCKPASFPDSNALIDFLLQQRNDLQPITALRANIDQIINILNQQIGCILARMSGSGATCFGLFDSKIQASDAAEKIRQRYNKWWVIATDLK